MSSCSITTLGQHRTIPALRLKHRSGSCGTASALPKCSIMSGCGTRIVLRGQKPLALCDRCPCFGSLFPPLAALTFAASSIICAFGLASAAPRSPYRHLELCGIALNKNNSERNGTNCSSVRCFILYTTRKHMVKLHKNSVHNYCRLYIKPLAFCAGILYYTSKKQRRFGIADPLLPRRILFFN